MITAGDVLKKKRESLGKNLETVSQDTKIQKRFLEYIEKNEFDRFESDVFLTGFIKIYSQYLKLDTNKVLALYRRDNPNGKLPQKNKKTDKKKFRINISKEKLAKFFTPKTIISISTGIFLIGILAYVGIQIYKFQSPPTISISEPTNEYTTTENTVLVKGQTNPDAILEINEHLVDLDEDGNFVESVDLNDGINTITIKARKNSNNILETVETRKVIYNKPEETEEDKTEEILINTLTLEVKNGSAWIRLDVDGVNKISQVVESSVQEFTVDKEFYVITGRSSNTFLSFNGDPVNWNGTNASGVVELTCTVKNNNIACQ
jgi:cytoskeletal protein RodZ